jgi:hypothetical protein
MKGSGVRRETPTCSSLVTDDRRAHATARNIALRRCSYTAVNICHLCIQSFWGDVHQKSSYDNVLLLLSAPPNSHMTSSAHHGLAVAEILLTRFSIIDRRSRVNAKPTNLVLPRVSRQDSSESPDALLRLISRVLGEAPVQILVDFVGGKTSPALVFFKYPLVFAWVMKCLQRPPGNREAIKRCAPTSDTLRCTEPAQTSQSSPRNRLGRPTWTKREKAG